MPMSEREELAAELERYADDVRSAIAERRFRRAASILRLPAETGAVEGWRSMESAPLDGTSCLIAWEGDVRLAYYVPDHECWEEVGSFDPLYEPTHWSPLPSPPIRTSGGTGEDHFDIRTQEGIPVAFIDALLEAANIGTGAREKMTREEVVRRWNECARTSESPR